MPDNQREIAETVFERNQRREAEISEALRQEHARREAAVLARETKLDNLAHK